MSMTSFIPFSLSNHLIPCFFGSHPKKTKTIISIQFVPSLCMGTDRLSYFGHTPRGELCEAGGQTNDYYYSHRLITEHLDPGAPTQRPHAEDIAEIDWQLVHIHFSPKLLYFFFWKHKCLQHKTLAATLQVVFDWFCKIVYAYRHESIQQAWVGFRWGLQPFHWPLFNDRRHLRVFCVEDAEPRHVDSTITIWLHVEGKKVLDV